jgi:E3 ubiquitin-protein ligase RNF1/2
MSTSNVAANNTDSNDDDDKDYHPDSKWEEPYTDNHNLTLYDLNRNPCPVQNPNRRITVVPMKSLNSEFICPICLGYFHKTSLVMECLHRFCDECIQKCLRLGCKKECPSCRIHIPSRRSLRHDPAFDLLLKHILGDVRVLEREEERQAALAKSRSKLVAVTRQRGMVHQAIMQNKQKAQKKLASSSNKNRASDVAAAAAADEQLPSIEQLTAMNEVAAAANAAKAEEKKKVDKLVAETTLDGMEVSLCYVSLYVYKYIAPYLCIRNLSTVCTNLKLNSLLLR